MGILAGTTPVPEFFALETSGGSSGEAALSTVFQELDASAVHE
ncbi:MAG TPA: hypothetical protein VGP82_02500 [Ktedonobacterales bacterium]|nr:hypothetical protein [Ktedonobacterales bacterium]